MSSFKMKYDCEEAKKDIDLIFSVGIHNTEGESAFWRAMRHIAHSRTSQKHKISCSKCWRYFKRKKKKIQKIF